MAEEACTDTKICARTWTGQGQMNSTGKEGMNKKAIFQTMIHILQKPLYVQKDTQMHI